jgi:hypothetical protein
MQSVISLVPVFAGLSRICTQILRIVQCACMELKYSILKCVYWKFQIQVILQIFFISVIFCLYCEEALVLVIVMQRKVGRGLCETFSACAINKIGF